MHEALTSLVWWHFSEAGKFYPEQGSATIPPCFGCFECAIDRKSKWIMKVT